MDCTLLYLAFRVFESPFDFFQQFGDYWEERGWQRIGHQLEDLFIRLRAFLEACGPSALEPDLALGLMKYDYFLNHRYKPRAVWWEFRMDKREHAAWMRRLAERPEEVSPAFAALAPDEQQLRKHTVIERLSFDLAAWLERGEFTREAETLLVVCYGLGTEGASAHLLRVSPGMMPESG